MDGRAPRLMAGAAREGLLTLTMAWMPFRALRRCSGLTMMGSVRRVSRCDSLRGS